MTGITLIRHAAVDSGWEGRCYGTRCDPALSPEGAAQAAILGQRIPADAVIISSPARRARETAQHIARDFTIDARWAERDFGDWEGLSWDECWAVAPAIATVNTAAYAEYCPPNAEPFAGVLARVADALAAARTASGPTYIVTHAGTIRGALMHSGLPLEVAFATTIAPCDCVTLPWP